MENCFAEKRREIREIYETGWKYEMGITKELFIFLSAILSGAIVRLVYRCISCLRNVIHHTLDRWWKIWHTGSEPQFFVCADLLHK